MALSDYARKKNEKSKSRGEFHLPSDHVPGIRVPKGGSMCGNCRFLGDDKKTCTQSDFIEWNGSEVIPAPIDEYCSDYYEPSDAALRKMGRG